MELILFHLPAVDNLLILIICNKFFSILSINCYFLFFEIYFYFKFIVDFILLFKSLLPTSFFFFSLISYSFLAGIELHKTNGHGCDNISNFYVKRYNKYITVVVADKFKYHNGKGRRENILSVLGNYNNVTVCKMFDITVEN